MMSSSPTSPPLLPSESRITHRVAIGLILAFMGFIFFGSIWQVIRSELPALKLGEKRYTAIYNKSSKVTSEEAKEIVVIYNAWLTFVANRVYWRVIMPLNFMSSFIATAFLAILFEGLRSYTVFLGTFLIICSVFYIALTTLASYITWHVLRPSGHFADEIILDELVNS